MLYTAAIWWIIRLRLHQAKEWFTKTSAEEMKSWTYTLFHRILAPQQFTHWSGAFLAPHSSATIQQSQVLNCAELAAVISQPRHLPCQWTSRIMYCTRNWFAIISHLSNHTSLMKVQGGAFKTTSWINLYILKTSTQLHWHFTCTMCYLYGERSHKLNFQWEWFAWSYFQVEMLVIILLYILYNIYNMPRSHQPEL